MKSLNDIGKKYGTDKCDRHHCFKGKTYLDVYEMYLQHLRQQPINLLEIGVRAGPSLRMWKEFFPNANIYGLDNNPTCKQHEEDRIKITIGSQVDETVLKSLVDESDGFDVVLDDGSHINSLTIKSAKYLLPHVKSNGFYIIEDLKTSYQDLGQHIGHWQGELTRNHKDGVDLCNLREDMNTFFMDIVREIDYVESEIESVHFWSKICILLK